MSTRAELSGSESALVVAAVFTLAHWPFERAGAKELVSKARRAAGEKAGKAISARWRDHLDSAGLWNTVVPWTPEVIAKRAALKAALFLDPEEIPTAIFALDLVTIEFAKSWEEFCIVAPGALDWYPVGLEDVERLARRLESVVGA